MAVQVHSQRGMFARPALQGAAPRLRARGLAVWVAPGTGREIDAEVLVRAARLVLERAVKFAPEAEVHWPAGGAGTPAAGTDDAPAAEDQGKEPDGVSRLPPSAGPVHQARHADATVRGGGYQFIPGASATVRGPAEYSI